MVGVQVRKKKPVTYVLPEDIIRLINECAAMVGIPRSTFLQVFLDAHKSQMVAFAKGLAARLDELEELLGRGTV